jgi:hypothetical protein
MSDLKTRFRPTEHIPTPDLWPDISHPRAQLPGREPGPGGGTHGPGEGTRRVLAGAVALVVAAAGTFLAYSAFRERSVLIPAGPVEPTLVPDLAVVICEGANISIQVGTVAARSDGVHVEVINPTDRTLAFGASDTDEFHDVPPGTSTFVESFFFSPGSHYVACGPGGRLPGAFEHQIHVDDPNGVWTPTDLVCPGDEQWGHDVSVEGDDPIEVARSVLSDRVRASDELRFAGYPESPTRRVVVLLRDGEPIAEVWMEAHHGGWAGTLVNGCP